MLRFDGQLAAFYLLLSIQLPLILIVLGQHIVVIIYETLALRSVPIDISACGRRICYFHFPTTTCIMFSLTVSKTSFFSISSELSLSLSLMAGCLYLRVFNAKGNQNNNFWNNLNACIITTSSEKKTLKNLKTYLIKQLRLNKTSCTIYRRRLCSSPTLLHGDHP